eukprot:3904349-Amphidinium_carterae.1
MVAEVVLREYLGYDVLSVLNNVLASELEAHQSKHLNLVSTEPRTPQIPPNPKTFEVVPLGRKSLQTDLHVLGDEFQVCNRYRYRLQMFVNSI